MSVLIKVFSFFEMLPLLTDDFDVLKPQSDNTVLSKSNLIDKLLCISLLKMAMS